MPDPFYTSDQSRRATPLGCQALCQGLHLILSTALWGRCHCCSHLPGEATRGSTICPKAVAAEWQSHDSGHGGPCLSCCAVLHEGSASEALGPPPHSKGTLASGHTSLACWEADLRKGIWEREGECPASVSLPLELPMLPKQSTGSFILSYSV